MPNRFGQVWTTAVEVASIAAGDVYFLAGQEYEQSTPEQTTFHAPDLTGQSSDGGVDWDDPTQIRTQDALTCNVSLTTAASSEVLFAGNFNFSIPAGATIDGVDYTIWWTTLNTPPTLEARLYSTMSTSDYIASTAATVGDVGNEITGSFGSGSSAISISVINSSAFTAGFVATQPSGSGTATIDYVSVRVRYTTNSYQSRSMFVRALGADVGFINAAGSGEAEDQLIPVDIIVGDYNTSTALTLVGTTTGLERDSSSTKKPQLYKGAYGSVVNAQVKKRIHINPRYPASLDLLGIEKFTGNNGTTRVAGTDVPFVGLHFPTAVSKAMKLTLLSES